MSTLLLVLGGCLLGLALDPKTHERVRAWARRWREQRLVAERKHRAWSRARADQCERAEEAMAWIHAEAAKDRERRRFNEARDQWRADNPGKTVPWGWRV